jgi:hypothetical protein
MIYIQVMQCFRVVYPRISYLSVVFAIYAWTFKQV